MKQTKKVTKEKVLLTGISGYIGLYCAKELLEAGFSVRGTVRNSEKKKQVLDTLGQKKVNTKNLEFAVLDLTSEKGWGKAIEDCTYIMHVASPFSITNPKNDADMIVPAVEGTNRIMKLAKKAKIKRVVLTSSIVSMMCSIRHGQFGPEDWTDVNYPKLNTYIKSKILAEKGAWAALDKGKKSENPELVVIAPGGVFGPPLGDDITGESLTILSKMLDGKIPFVPKTAFPMVDVRDVAHLHVKALKNKTAAGKRFIASGADPISFAGAATILNENGYKGPSTKIAPAWLLNFMALFDREAKGMVAILDMHLKADNSATLKTFKWKPIPFEKSLIDSALAVTEIKAQ
jgi:dihydroflavonol-4-reductase